MKLLIFTLALLLGASTYAQENEPKDTKWTMVFDSSVLRLPGKKFRIGLSEKLDNGNMVSTNGLLKGKLKWKNFRIDVTGGTFNNGKIFISDTNIYLRGNAMLVKVYDLKSGKLLLTQGIPYNYEKNIKLFTKSEMKKVPGSAAKFGIRITFDNGMWEDVWPSNSNIEHDDLGYSARLFVKTKLANYLTFLLTAEGGFFHRKYLIIESDPLKIINHRASFVVTLQDDPAIKDTLKNVLNYIANYSFDSRYVHNYCLANDEDQPEFKISFATRHIVNQGHNLEVFADIYRSSGIKDTLLLIVINDLDNCEHYNYIVNSRGGRIRIISHGIDGSNGINGSNGIDGTNGIDGSSGSMGSTNTITKTNSDGSTTTETVTGPGGDGGNGSSGSDGSSGGNGTNGSDGENGGEIYFNYTAAVQPYLHLIKVLSVPGSGGTGGKGGSGGHGGKGGRGGSGGYGNPSGRSGSDGRDGNNGVSGTDGSRGNNGISGNVSITMIK